MYLCTVCVHCMHGLGKKTGVLCFQECSPGCNMLKNKPKTAASQHTNTQHGSYTLLEETLTQNKWKTVISSLFFSKESCWAWETLTAIVSLHKHTYAIYATVWKATAVASTGTQWQTAPVCAWQHIHHVQPPEADSAEGRGDTVFLPDSARVKGKG